MDRTEAELYLKSFADLSRFWICRGLIYYVDAHGTSFVMMDDDDERVDVCIELLESMNCRVFSDIDEMDRYAEQLEQSIAPNDSSAS